MLNKHISSLCGNLRSVDSFLLFPFPQNKLSAGKHHCNRQGDKMQMPVLSQHMRGSANYTGLCSNFINSCQRRFRIIGCWSKKWSDEPVTAVQSDRQWDMIWCGIYSSLC